MHHPVAVKAWRESLQRIFLAFFDSRIKGKLDCRPVFTFPVFLREQVCRFLV
jgi:hypothetical protein